MEELKMWCRECGAPPKERCTDGGQVGGYADHSHGSRFYAYLLEELRAYRNVMFVLTVIVAGLGAVVTWLSLQAL